MKNMSTVATSAKHMMTYYFRDGKFHPITHTTAYFYLNIRCGGRFFPPVFNSFGKTISYKDLFKVINESANAFAALDIKEGDSVCFLSDFTPECVAALYGLNKLGAIASIIDTEADVNTIQEIINENNSTVLVVIDTFFSKIKDTLADINQKSIVILPSFKPLSFSNTALGKIRSKLIIHPEKSVLSWNKFISRGKGTPAKEVSFRSGSIAIRSYSILPSGTVQKVDFTNESLNEVSHYFRYSELSFKSGARVLNTIGISSPYGVVCGLHMLLCEGLEVMFLPRNFSGKFNTLISNFTPHFIIGSSEDYDLIKRIDVPNIKPLFFTVSSIDNVNYDTADNSSEANIKIRSLSQDYVIRESISL